MEQKLKQIYVYTGDGRGKTTAALGLALRAVGQGKKIVIIQFMKTKINSGEYKIQKILGENYKLYLFGTREPKALDFAYEIIKQKPDILILDEINLAINRKLVPLKKVIEFLEDIPKDIVVVLTGRNAPKKIIDMACLVTKMQKIKHHYDAGYKAQRGLEY